MRRLILPLAVAAALALPAAASALIQVDKGIAGARIGNTGAQVRAALGKPVKRIVGMNDFGTFVEYRYPGAGLTITFQGGSRVTAVSLTGKGDRTKKGAGVGTTEKRLKALHPGLKCETIVGTRSCHTGSFRPGQIVTDFAIRRGKVVRVTVGRVID